jgi:uracil-DNA glycosylase
MGVGDDAFYDSGLVAVVPMGFCFPGTDAKGGDLPPRRECAEVWRVRVMGALPDVELLILIGQYAQRWHLGSEAMRGGVTQTVRAWRAIYCPEARPRVLPLPHPSWRNNGWLRKNDWFEADLLPVLRAEVSRALAGREADLKTPPSTR